MLRSELVGSGGGLGLSTSITQRTYRCFRYCTGHVGYSSFGTARSTTLLKPVGAALLGKHSGSLLFWCSGSNLMLKLWLRSARSWCWEDNSIGGPSRSVVIVVMWTCRSASTVGIMPGSWWAHHELGRGGWWFRDPVENASALCRLLSTGSIHAVNRVMATWWSHYITIATGLVFLSVSYSIRSGVLATLHSFAIG